MLKKFIEWIYTKIYIDTKERGIVIQRGEVYWCSLGENIGYEENGKGENFRRPVLIFRKFNNSMFWGLPMTSQNKNTPFCVQVVLESSTRSVLTSQLRTLDTKRLDQKIGFISREDFLRVKESVIFLID